MRIAATLATIVSGIVWSCYTPPIDQSLPPWIVHLRSECPRCKATPATIDERHEPVINCPEMKAILNEYLPIAIEP